MTCLLVLGDQLFPVSRELLNLKERTVVFMAEDVGLCTHFKYHQHKLVLFLSAMRHFRDELVEQGFQVDYHELSTAEQEATFEARLETFLKKRKIREVVSYEVSDRFFEEQLGSLFRRLGVEWKRLESPGFVTPREEFARYLNSVRKPFMKTFYEAQRRRLGVLVDKSGKPEGGQWSFDEENREKLPAKLKLPGVATAGAPDTITREVIELVSKRFGDHPGDARTFWLPVDRAGARAWLRTFLRERLADFGAYEDALSTRDPFLFHSVLTPFLNTGLLTPQEVIGAVLKEHEKRDLPLNSIEGFIRQVIGWREFIFGIDRHFGEKQHSLNHFGHERRLTKHWYDGTTGLVPLDDVIRKANRYGFAHHIERLMVAGNFMLLSEVHPLDAYRWFMELFIDSADWVMGPNVFGMGIHSDGGIFATKPYICGSNYLLKMSDYGKGPWCEVADGLYWSFIAKHQKSFVKNPRMATMARAYDRLAASRRETLHRAAEDFKSRVTR
jgi:deoxyribodipyrimidine photolyase-related protein